MIGAARVLWPENRLYTEIARSPGSIEVMGTLKLERIFKEILVFLSHFKLKYKSVTSL